MRLDLGSAGLVVVVRITARAGLGRRMVVGPCLGVGAGSDLAIRYSEQTFLDCAAQVAAFVSGRVTGCGRARASRRAAGAGEGLPEW